MVDSDIYKTQSTLRSFGRAQLSIVRAQDGCYTVVIERVPSLEQAERLFAQITALPFCYFPPDQYGRF